MSSKKFENVNTLVITTRLRIKKEKENTTNYFLIGITKSNEPNLKVVATTSHVALSGNVTVFILRTSDMEFSTVSTIITSNSSTNDIRKDEKDKKVDSEKEGSSRSNKSFALTYVKIRVS